MDIPLSAAQQAFENGTTLICMVFLKKSFTSNEKNVFYIRIAFATSSVIHILLALFLRYVASKYKLEVKLLKYKPETSFFNLSECGGQEELEKTYSEYDKEEVDEYIRSLLFQAALRVFLSYRFNVVQPLIIKTINIIKFLYLYAPVWTYFYGKPIKRPNNENFIFKAPVETAAEPQDKKKKKKED